MRQRSKRAPQPALRESQMHPGASIGPDLATRPSGAPHVNWSAVRRGFGTVRRAMTSLPRVVSRFELASIRALRYRPALPDIPFAITIRERKTRRGDGTFRWEGRPNHGRGPRPG
jgi:hypothetical protein